MIDRLVFRGGPRGGGRPPGRPKIETRLSGRLPEPHCSRGVVRHVARSGGSRLSCRLPEPHCGAAVDLRADRGSKRMAPAYAAAAIGGLLPTLERAEDRNQPYCTRESVSNGETGRPPLSRFFLEAVRCDVGDGTSPFGCVGDSASCGVLSVLSSRVLFTVRVSPQWRPDVGVCHAWCMSVRA